MYTLNNNITLFDSSGVEHIPKEIKKFIGNKNIQPNIFRIQVHNLVMYGYFCFEFIDFMLKNKNLTDFINLSTNYFKKKKKKKKKNDDIIVNYFKNGWI